MSRSHLRLAVAAYRSAESVYAIPLFCGRMRDGRNACDSQTMAGLGRQDLVRLMIGRDERIPDWPARGCAGVLPALTLKGVSTALGHKGR
jgi:hypothetical protein